MRALTCVSLLAMITTAAGPLAAQNTLARKGDCVATSVLEIAPAFGDCALGAPGHATVDFSQSPEDCGLRVHYANDESQVARLTD